MKKNESIRIDENLNIILTYTPLSKNLRQKKYTPGTPINAKEPTHLV